MIVAGGPALQRLEAVLFARRALADFGLAEAFNARGSREQTACLEWIAAAGCGGEEESRVTRMIDQLRRGGRLPAGGTAR